MVCKTAHNKIANLKNQLPNQRNFLSDTKKRREHKLKTNFPLEHTAENGLRTTFCRGFAERFSER